MTIFFERQIKFDSCAFLGFVSLINTSPHKRTTFYRFFTAIIVIEYNDFFKTIYIAV